MSPMGIMPGARWLNSRNLRWARWGIAILFGLYLSYVAAVFLALRLGVLEKISESNADLQMSARTGHSLWPGRITVQELDFRVKDHLVEVQVLAGRATVGFSFLNALSGELHLDEVVVRQGKFRLLHRVHDGYKNRARLKAFPKIFPRSHVVQRQKQNQKRIQFPVMLSNVDADFDEVWIMEYRGRGQVHASGGVKIVPTFHIFDAEVEFENAAVSIGQQEASQSSCQIQADVGPVNLPSSSGLDVLGSIEAKVQCQSQIHHFSPLKLYAPHSSVGVAGSGTIDVSARLNGGKLVDTEARLKLPELELSLAGRTLAATVQADLTSSTQGAMALELQMHDALSRSGVPRSLGMKSFQGSASFSPEKLWELQLFSLKARVQELSIADPRMLASLFRIPSMPAVQLAAGNGEFSYERATEERRLQGSFEGRGTLSLQDGTSLGCALLADVACEVSGPKTQCDGSSLSCTSARMGGMSAKPLDLSLNVAQLRHSPKEGFATRVHLDASNPKPWLKDLVGDSWLKKTGISLLPLGPLEAQLTLDGHPDQFGGYRWQGTLSDFKSGALSGKARFAFESTLLARGLLRTPVGTWGIARKPSGVSVQPFASKNWFAQPLN